MIDPALAKLVIENAHDYAIMVLDVEGRIRAWSPGAERILGYSSDEAVGMAVEALFLEPDRVAGVPQAEIARTLANGRAEDTRWHLRKTGERFWANGVSMRLGAGDGVVKVMRDETRGKLAEDQRVLLLNELNHRIKNTLATVQSIVSQTLRGAGVAAEVREALTERLIALSEAHNVLVHQNWAGAELHAIVAKALSVHDAGLGRFEVEGPAVRLSPQQAVALSLALHELATNAIKYGALSNEAGRVRVTWNLAYEETGGRGLNLLWEERGGPPVAPPQRRGFGTRLIARSFGAESGGRARIEYPATGVRCILELPLTAQGELPIMAVGEEAAS